MATRAYNVLAEPSRHSAETDRRHLLAPSAAPSAAPSILDFTADPENDDDTGSRTPRANSPATSAAAVPAAPESTSAEDEQPYRGFASRAAYLAALHEWAESKKYIQPDDDARRAVKGFYGDTTMAEYAARPGLELGLRKKWKARKERKASIGR